MVQPAAVSAPSSDTENVPDTAPASLANGSKRPKADVRKDAVSEGARCLPPEFMSNRRAGHPSI